VRLTPGGRRLAAAASEILGIAEQARRNVREARGEGATLRVAADAAVAEHAAGPLLDAFSARNPGLDVALLVEPAEAFPGLLVDRLADIALGGPCSEPGVECAPFLRYRLVVVAGPEHALAGRRAVRPAELASDTWLTGPSGTEPSAELASMPHEEVLAFPSDAAALDAAAAGRGLMLAVAHTVLTQLSRGTVVRVDVAGTPLDRLWHASALSGERRTPAAGALGRFVTTPEATQAMLSGSGGVPAERFRPPVYVTLWDG
jgi:DNA-binding transcriptional LysR family regulator